MSRRPVSLPPRRVGARHAQDHALGENLRQLRKERGLTLQELAAKTGVTKGFLSQVENGVSDPSLLTLRNLGAVLEVPVFALLAAGEEYRTIVRKNQRIRIDSEGPGVIFELVSPNIPESSIEVVLTELEPGRSTANRATTHIGEECGIVLHGRMRVEVGTEVFDLMEGDSLWFRGQIPHRMINTATTKAVLLSVISPPSF